MRDIRKRNLQILQMSRDGIRHGEIARIVRLSRTNIDGIVCRLVSEEELERKISRLREEMRRDDDLDQEWITTDLLDALRLMTVTRKALSKLFESREVISLRNLMDVTILEMDDPKLAFRITKLLEVRYIGKKGFWSIIHGISHLVPGERCRREWEQRLDRLRHVWGISGEFPYS